MITMRHFLSIQNQLNNMGTEPPKNQPETAKETDEKYEYRKIRMRGMRHMTVLRNKSNFSNSERCVLEGTSVPNRLAYEYHCAFGHFIVLRSRKVE